jgi:hypothetical protein
MALNVSGILSPVNGPAQQTYTAPDLTIGFGSITIYNSSNSSVNVYLNNVGILSATPDFVVPALCVITNPIPGINKLTVAFVTYPSTGGNCQVTLCDTVLSSASSLLPGSIGQPSVLPSALGPLGDVPGNMQFANASCEGLGSNNGAASSFGILNSPAFITGFAGTYTYVYSISIQGLSSTLTNGSPASAVAFLKLCSTSTGGTTFQFYQWAQTTLGAAPLNTYNIGMLPTFGYSGGSLPLFYTNTALYAVFGDITGVANTSSLYASINVAYAVY